MGHTHTHGVQGDAEPPCDSCIHSAHGDGNAYPALQHLRQIQNIQ